MCVYNVTYIIVCTHVYARTRETWRDEISQEPTRHKLFTTSQSKFFSTHQLTREKGSNHICLQTHCQHVMLLLLGNTSVKPYRSIVIVPSLSLVLMPCEGSYQVGVRVSPG